MITDQLKNKIESIVNVYESGHPDGDYGCISEYNDGPGHEKQITYGKSQTTEFGNLKYLIADYIDAKGTHSEDFKPFMSKIGHEQLWNTKLPELLKAASADPIMHETQDKFFDEHYWQPSQKWFAMNRFTLGLSALVIYDSFVHSGSILGFLRQRFTAKVPVNGGDEKEWIKEYVNVRNEWLTNHSMPALRQTVYRTHDFIRNIKFNNWDMSQIFFANGTKIV